MDALCVGPWFGQLWKKVSVSFYGTLKGVLEVSEIHCVKDAKVPLMRFKFEGISVDLPYDELQVMAGSEIVDLLKPMFLTSIDETSWNNLYGVRVN